MHIILENMEKYANVYTSIKKNSMWKKIQYYEMIGNIMQHFLKSMPKHEQVLEVELNQLQLQLEELSAEYLDWVNFHPIQLE